MNTPRWALLTVLLLLTASSPARGADDVVISTGPQRGSYYYIGSRLRTELMVEHNQASEVKTSHGSLANLAALDDMAGPVNVALTQTDALDQYLEANPAFADAFFVLGDVGRECAFVIAAKRSGVQTADALVESGGQVSVGDAESGSAVTWQGLTRLAPAFAALEVVHAPTMEALLQLKVGAGYTKLRAAMWVQRPRRVSPPMETVLADPGSYQLVAIRPDALASRKLPDGRPVYSFERVVIGRGQNASRSVETVCTRALMLGAKRKLSIVQRERLSTLMLEASERIVGPDE